MQENKIRNIVHTVFSTTIIIAVRWSETTHFNLRPRRIPKIHVSDFDLSDDQLRSRSGFRVRINLRHPVDDAVKIFGHADGRADGV